MSDKNLSYNSSFKHFIEGNTEEKIEGTTRQGCRLKRLLDALRKRKENGI
jgi:hypothetical protein